MAKQTPTLKTAQSTACGHNIIYNNQLRRLNYAAVNICTPQMRSIFAIYFKFENNDGQQKQTTWI
jgi:hypothetical protein